MSHRNSERLASKALRVAAQFWFLVALVGLWAFVYYLLAYYVFPALQGGLEAWATKRLPNGYIPGDAMGNLAVAVHLFMAVIVTGFGPLQLIPKIRARFPSFHRWNGRVYIVTAIATSLAGFYMVWVRGDDIGNTVQHLGNSLAGVLTISFAILAWRYALARDFKIHRRWALRVFMVVNAAWFLRIGYQLSNFLNSGTIGFDPKVFSSPLFSPWTFGSYFLPLALLELYFRTQDRAGMTGKFAMAGTLIVVTVLMGIGIVNATLGMWLPRLQSF